MKKNWPYQKIFCAPKKAGNLAYSGGIFLYLLYIFVFAGSALADNRIVKIGVYENEPKVFTSKSGKPSGIFIDIIEYIAEKEGWQLQYVKGTWAEGLDRLETGKIDLMPDVASTVERERKFSFHKITALSSWSQVYASKGSKIQSILDLDKKRIAVLEGSVQQSTFNQFSYGFDLDITIVPVPSYEAVFEAVVKGEADAAITNRFYGLAHAKNLGLEDTAVVFEPAALFFAAKKGSNKDLLNAIDKYLSNLKNNPGSIYYSSMKRWTSEEIGFKFPAWLKTFGLIVGLILLMSLAGSLILKRQVDARTKELKLINREMDQRIVERTAQLAQAMEKAQEADRLKSAFLATMSHELRTPLNSIIGFTGIILRERVGPLNDEQKKQLNMVKNSSQHLLALINDVLDISKIEAGQLQLVSEEINLPQIIEKALQSVRPLAESKGIELKHKISPDINSARGDNRRVEQILLNLLSNAIKFTEKGFVETVAEIDGDNIIIRVLDTGIGIKKEDMETIFENFRQIDSGLSRKYEGTGLGLSISKRLAELMGGKIWVESVWSKGSTFSFSLPKKGV
ncbi:MAG TPA: transporter substrate-binding domain-containing protein [Deltaproteobacteria bacterium]|nr:transporter substrate-binding domain-containing protein [Deltaproteobacteria bacterium]